MATVTFDCGHKGRISLSGTAVEKSEQMFDATLRDCPKCAEFAAWAEAHQDDPEGDEMAAAHDAHESSVESREDTAMRMYDMLRAMDNFEMDRLMIRDQLAAARIPDTAERHTCEYPACDMPAQYTCSQCQMRVCSFDSDLRDGQVLCHACCGYDD